MNTDKYHTDQRVDTSKISPLRYASVEMTVSPVIAVPRQRIKGGIASLDHMLTFGQAKHLNNEA